MESWIETIRQAIGTNLEVCQQALTTINEAVNSADLNFISFAAQIISNAELEISLRNATAVFLSRVLTAKNINELNGQRKILLSPENAELMKLIKESLVTTSLSSVGELKATCYYMLSLILNIERENFAEEITHVFSESDLVASLHLLEYIASNPCASEFADNGSISPILRNGIENILQILALPLEEEKNEERILASKVLILIINNMKSLIDGSDAVHHILDSIVASFQVPNFDLFRNLYQILFCLCDQFYEHIDEFYGKIFDYLVNGMQMQNIEYVQIVMEFWEEFSKNESLNNLDKDREYVCVNAFPMIFDHLLRYLQTGFASLNNVYKVTYDVIVNIIKMNPSKISLFLVEAINTIIDGNEDGNNEKTFCVLHLIAALKTVKLDLTATGKGVSDFLIGKFDFIYDNLQNEDERIRIAAIFCLSELISKQRNYLFIISEDSNDLIHDLVNLIYKISSESNNIYLIYFSRFLVHLFGIFTPNSPNNNLYLHFGFFTDILLELATNPLTQTSLKFSSNLSAALMKFLQNMPKSTGEKATVVIEFYNKLASLFIDSFAAESDVFLYQKVLCSGLCEIIEKVKHNLAFKDLLPHIKNALKINNTLLFSDAFPVYAAIVKYNDFDEYSDFAAIVDFGIDSGDTSVINSISVGIYGVSKNCRNDFIEHIPHLFDSVMTMIGQLKDQNIYVPIPGLVRAASALIKAAFDAIRSNESIYQFLLQIKERFELLLTVYNEVEISVQFIDQIDFDCDLFGSIFTAFSVYVEMLNCFIIEEEKAAVMKNFIKGLFIPCAKKAYSIKCSSKNECDEFIKMMRMFSECISKRQHVLVMHRGVQRLIKMMQDNNKEREAELIDVKELFGFIEKE